MKGLTRSVGDLCLEPKQYVFTTKRLFRKRIHQIPLNHVSAARLNRGLFMDKLTFTIDGVEQVFDVFKIHQTLQPAWLRELAKVRDDSPATSSS